MPPDETNKAASVRQLQELVTSLPALIEAPVKKSVTDAISGAMAGLESRFAALDAKITASAAQQPDFMPLLAKLDALISALTAEEKPAAKTGTIKLPGGETIELRIEAQTQ